jgi:hypothetical protein
LEARSPAALDQPLETMMGKYVIAWLLGVPALVLVVIYMFFR